VADQTAVGLGYSSGDRCAFRRQLGLRLLRPSRLPKPSKIGVARRQTGQQLQCTTNGVFKEGREACDAGASCMYLSERADNVLRDPEGTRAALGELLV